MNIAILGRESIIISRKIDFEKFLIFDGAMGTLLQKHGLK